MKYPLVLFLLCCFGLKLSGTTTPPEDKVMYVIIVGDTRQSSGIGGGVQQDVNRVYNGFRYFASLMGYQFEHEVITEQNRLHRDTILKSIRKIPRETDVVVFYYSGHGECRSEGEKMPYLKVDGGLVIQELLNDIRRKQPRFLLMLTDCCNNPPPTDYRDQITRRSDADDLLLSNLNHLFNDYRGEVVATASRYGERAYMGGNGSYFTCAFFDTFAQMGSIIHPFEWENWLKRVQERTVDIVEREKFDSQTPYFEITIQE
ncbi:MAG: caspase family protein [Bacteroidota bacterium]